MSAPGPSHQSLSEQTWTTGFLDLVVLCPQMGKLKVDVLTKAQTVEELNSHGHHLSAAHLWMYA